VRRRATGTAPPRAAAPTPADDVAVPPQDGAGSDDEQHRRKPAGRQRPGEQGQPCRSGHVSREQALGRSRSAIASWCRSIKISASFHHDSRHERPSTDTARETTRKINFKPTSRRSSHHRAGHRVSARRQRPATFQQAFGQTAQVFGTLRVRASRSGAAAGVRAAAWPGRQAPRGQPSLALAGRPDVAVPRPRAGGPRSPCPLRRRPGPGALANRTPGPRTSR
jgi:hypothetical protein